MTLHPRQTSRVILRTTSYLQVMSRMLLPACLVSSEGLSDDTVITADMLRQVEEEGQNDLLDKALIGLQKNYPDISAAMEARELTSLTLKKCTTSLQT